MKGTKNFYDRTAPDWAARGYANDDIPCLADFARRYAPYDRNFIGHTLEELKAAALGLFRFEREIGWDATDWHNYIFTAI